MSRFTNRLVFVTALAVLYALWAFATVSATAPIIDLVDTLLHTTAMVVAGILLGYFARKHAGRAARAWWAASLSAACSSGIFAVEIWADFTGAKPSTWIGDGLWFASIILLLVAILLLPQVAPGPVDRTRMVLDGAIVACALLLISWYVVLGDTLRSIDVFTAEAAVFIGYPLADVISVAVAVIALYRSSAAGRRPLALLVLGVISLAVADTAYGLLIISGEWFTGHPVSVFWFIAYPLMAVAASYRNVEIFDAGESAAQTRVRVALLLGPVAVALVLTAFSPAERVTVVALAVLMALVLTRQTIAVYAELQLRATLERRVEEQTAELREQVYVDSVTGLGNRTMLRERAAGSELVVDSAALLLLDLDGFKEINDTLGHSLGDAVLTTLGHRLGGVTRQQDTVVRMGGDEFAVLLPETGRRAAMAAAHRILEALREPIRVGDVEVNVTGSVGVALAGSGLDVDELIRRADLAMYEAKADGGDEAKVFDPQMHLRLQNRLRLEAEIREAITAGQFTVYYQPIVDTRSGEVACLEALVRWDHPDRGVVSPYEFLAVAERTGAIIELGNFVLRTACVQLAEWRADWPELRVAVNLSHRELLDPALPERVGAALAESGLPGDALHLEVTETVLAADVHIRIPLDALVKRGVALSIDDFGTGHSSLSRIRELPAQRLKIDRSFVNEIQQGAAPLLESILALARSLEMTTVAEGVETEAQLEFLTRHGCDELQGYLFSRPVAAEHVIPVLFGTRSRSSWELAPDESPLPDLVAALTGDVVDLHSALRNLLRELSFLTGLETTFVTTVDSGHQITTHAHNGGDIAVPPGLSVEWDQTLCARLIEDDTLTVSAAQTVYGDVEAVRDLGIETYVSVPIRDTEGTLVGTLCAASATVQVVDLPLLSLMELFARVLSGRMGDLRGLMPESNAVQRGITAGQ